MEPETISKVFERFKALIKKKKKKNCLHCSTKASIFPNISHEKYVIFHIRGYRAIFKIRYAYQYERQRKYHENGPAKKMFLYDFVKSTL